MTNSEPVVWYAKTDDPQHALVQGAGIVAASFVPALLILCAGGLAGSVVGAFYLALLLVPVAIGYAVWTILRDRKAVITIELAGDRFTLIRNDRSRSTFAAREVKQIDVIRWVYDGTPEYTRMRLHVGGKIERTRNGPGRMPDGWDEAVRVTEVDVKYVTRRRRNS
ncbi:hypothetical protein AB0M02_27685 [Actinoplanes sp. NPDC051861]|uniref:hypothetical protein n=1 Tax=Actinoplanes sp. NPDC051861 TaxID=3155170 RepID=UPI00343442B2